MKIGRVVESGEIRDIAHLARQVSRIAQQPRGADQPLNMDRNWEITGAMAGLQVSVPALYIAGGRDFMVSFPGTDQLLANLKTFVPGLRKIQMLAGCGHWTQQERPNEVSAALVEFIRALPSR